MKEKTFLKGIAKGCMYHQLTLAINAADKIHQGQERLSGESALMHPIRVAAYLYALGEDEQDVLAAAVLHDTLEDGNVTPQDLLAMGIHRSVLDLVELVSKKRMIGGAPIDIDVYYDNIAKNQFAMLIKLSDRCHNVSTMVGNFSYIKIKNYIEETKKYVLPLCKILKTEYPSHSESAFIMRYHLESNLTWATEYLKTLLPRSSMLDSSPVGESVL